jgi:hypothetical protein
MPDGIRWVGLDVHAHESTIAIFDQATGELTTRRVVGRRGDEHGRRRVFRAGRSRPARRRECRAAGTPTSAGGRRRDPRRWLQP